MEIDQFLLDDYKLKCDYLGAHFSRMLTRFDFFLAVEAALFGFSFDTDGLGEYHLWLAGAGMVLCVTWFYFGAADNYLADHYRTQVQIAYELLTLRIGFPPNSAPSEAEERLYRDYSFVGDVRHQLIDNRLPLRFRIKWFSATELVVALPLIFLVGWGLRVTIPRL